MTEDPSALRWMIVGPEVSHLVAYYEAGSKKANKDNEQTSHHEQIERVQKVFLKNVEKLFKAITDMSNPFQDDRGTCFH